MPLCPECDGVVRPLGYNLAELVSSGDDQVLVPLNAYLIGNLLACVMDHRDDGDWHGEMQWILAQAAEALSISTVKANDGRQWTLREQRWSR